MKLAAVEAELIAAHPYFKWIAPGPISLVKPTYINRPLKVAGAAWKARKIVKRYRGGESAGHILGSEIGGKVVGKAMKKPRNAYKKQLVKASRIRHDYTRKNGIGGRSWITEPGRYRMVIVFHDANGVGPHIDVHIDRVSLVYKLQGKTEVTDQIKYKRDGTLTDDSVKVLLNHVRSEIANGSRVAQNIDHTKTNARANWVNGDPNAKGYGAGVSRQVISETDVDIYKCHYDQDSQLMEMYAPVLNPHRAVYLYRLYKGDSPRTPHKQRHAPICIFGAKKAGPPTLEDRLHLKMIDPKDMEKLLAKADMSTSTLKYDGASCYFVITKKGTTVWSPRTSVKTNERIEYTFKVDGVAYATNDETIVGMGELLYKDKDGNYVPASTVGGTLNAQAVVPADLTPEIRIYRVDRWGRQNTKNMEFWENRKLQEKAAKLSPRLQVVELMQPEEAMNRGAEGVVVVPEGGSVNDGFKMKWWDDAEDWTIESVDFFPGEKGGVAGVVRVSHTEHGEMNLGPGQVGNQALTRNMMANPDDYKGAVLMVESRRGGAKRAAKARAIRLHQDKGFAPI
jgi:hypothetical protein